MERLWNTKPTKSKAKSKSVDFTNMPWRVKSQKSQTTKF